MHRVSHSRGVLASALVFAVSIPAAHAQTAIWNWDGAGNNDQYGWAVCVPGDIDRDGTDDVLVGNPTQQVAELRSGATGQVLWTNFGGTSFGSAFAVIGDVNADGYVDFAVGDPHVYLGSSRTGQVHVVSGRYAATEVGTEYLFVQNAWALPGIGSQFGFAIRGIGDQNADGVRDVVVGSPNSNQVAVISGSNGAILRTMSGPPTSGRFGHAIEVIGDVDADGIEDFAVGAPDSAPSSSTNAGALYRVSGATAAVIPSLTVNGPQSGGHFGASLSRGDFDGDGAVDLAVGEPNYKLNGTLVDQGRVHVYPRASIAFLRRIVGVGASGLMGYAVALDADFDGDGRSDLLVGSPLEWVGTQQLGRVRIYSFGAADPLHVVEGTSHLSHFGVSVAWMPNGGGDSTPEIVVGSPKHDAPGQTDSGRAWVLRFDEAVGASFCLGDGTGAACPCNNSGLPGRGCQNSFATGGASLTAIGEARVSNDSVMLQVGALPPGTSVLFYQGTSTQNGGLGVAFGDGLRCVGGTVIRLASKSALTQVAVYPNEGIGEAPISVRGLIPAAGGVRRYQAWYRNTASYCTPSSFNLSNGLEIAWQP